MAKMARMSRQLRVVAPALGKLRDRNLRWCREVSQRRHKAPAYRPHQRRRWQRLSAMLAEKPYNSWFALQPRHIDVEVHPVDPFDRKLHMTVDNIGHALCYHCLGSGRAVLPLAGV